MNEPDPSNEASEGSRFLGGLPSTWIAAILCIALGWVGASRVSMERSMGWDESMHAALPAARMAAALELGRAREAFDVFVDCQQYPPLHPTLLAVAAGADERSARGVGRWLLALGLFGLFGATRAATRGLCSARAPWIALALGASSPLALAYSGTLFLEVPFLSAASLALWAWIARDRAASERARLRRELLAGLLVTAAFYTKFNYGLLLGLGLAADQALRLIAAARAGEGRRELVRTALLAAPFLLVGLWWFLWPYPAGPEVARGHREAFLAFLRGNTQLATTPYAQRAWDLVTFFAPSARAAALIAAGMLASLMSWRSPGVRVLWLVAFASLGPMLAHNFHLDRFLLAPAPAIWALAAAGIAPRLPRRTGRAAAALAVLVVVAFVGRAHDAEVAARWLGVGRGADPAYLERLHAERRSLQPSRPLPTAGLARAEHDGFLDAVATAAGPEVRIGWLGVNSELSPAALHLGLLARGGSLERFARDAGGVRPDGEPEAVVTFQSADPGWDAERLRGWAQGFDVVFTTAPIDWKGRRGREFLETYRGWLFETGEWTYERVAAVAVARPVGEPVEVELFACCRSGS